MRLQIALLVECFIAVFKGAHEVARPIVLLQVDFQSLLTTVGLAASLYWAYKVLELLVRLCVVAQVSLGHERLPTAQVRTCERTVVGQLDDKGRHAQTGINIVLLQNMAI